MLVKQMTFMGDAAGIVPRRPRSDRADQQPGGEYADTAVVLRGWRDHGGRVLTYDSQGQSLEVPHPGPRIAQG